MSPASMRMLSLHSKLALSRSIVSVAAGIAMAYDDLPASVDALTTLWRKAGMF